MAKRPPRHKVNHKQRAKAISALSRIVESPTAAEYVVAKAASALLGAAKADDDALPERDPDAPGVVIFLPRKPLHPGQREGESLHDLNDRMRARAEGRRAAYCKHIGEPYNPMRALPCHPWPTPGSAPELEDEADRMADEAEAKEVERQRANPRPALVEILGPRADHPGLIIYDSSTEAGRVNYARWKAEAHRRGSRDHRAAMNAMTRHHIRLTGNRVTGAVELVSPEPVKAAATELLARGASPDDVLHVDAGEVNISPMPLGKIAAPRITPRRQEFLREMLQLPARR